MSPSCTWPRRIRSPVVIAIPGAKRPHWITDSAAAAELELPDDEIAALNAT